MTTPDTARREAYARIIENAMVLDIGHADWRTERAREAADAIIAKEAEALAHLGHANSTLYATQAEELALIGLARDSDRSEASRVLAEALARAAELEAGINKAIRKLSDSDEHEFSRILDARDALILARDAPLKAVLAAALTSAGDTRP